MVTSHELLSQATRFEPSITTGRVSGFKQNIGGQRVIQTDATIIQGNSGGPVFDDRGQVIGAATFTSFQGEQVVQGFNFLIPVETIQGRRPPGGRDPTRRERVHAALEPRRGPLRPRSPLPRVPEHERGG